MEKELENIAKEYGLTAMGWAQYAYHTAEPTAVLSKAITQVRQMGNYKVMVALVDLDKSKPKEERLYKFTDIESKKLREIIYKAIEKEM